MHIIFDLDGVIRDLTMYLVNKFNIPYPTVWFWKHEGKDFYDWVRNDDDLALLDAPATEYIDMIKKYKKIIEIWTCQPDYWKLYTESWVYKHFQNATISYLETPQKRERLDSCKGVYLVEDNPNFDNYNNILLIDRPYNQHIEIAPDHRIKTPYDLEVWLRREREAMAV